MRTCLVLGGKGFIGTHLIRALLLRGFKVRCFDRPHGTLLDGKPSDIPGLEIVEGDFSSELDLHIAAQGCDICYHLVSTTLPKNSNLDCVYDIQSNVVSSVKLFDIALRSGIKKIIFTSSGGTVYGTPLAIPITESHPTNPICSYGITKLTIEKYLNFYRNQHGLDYAVLRLGNPYGELQRAKASQGAIAVFVNKVLCGEDIEVWGDGSIVRDYVYITDVVEALINAISCNCQEKVFNIGSGKGSSIIEILNMISEVTKLPVNVSYLPAREFDVLSNVLDISRAKKFLNWTPKITMEEGVSMYINWLRKNI